LQQTHYNSNFKKQKHPVTLLCDNVTNAPNIGSLFRIADAFNIEELIFAGENIPMGRRISKTSRSTEKYVKFRIDSSVLNTVAQFKASHYIVGLEITDSSIELSKFKINTNQPILLIIGDENYGVSEGVLEQCDALIYINMYGANSSMNVVQAAGIALYEITKQLNA
jgi:tRNA G18 (ribose-2'-O)-methylase SpoU